MDYEWVDAKAAANLAKHGIDFLDAIGALADPLRIEHIDDSFIYGEARVRTIGMTRGNVLFVVTTMRADDLWRIISARKATRHEQNRYFAAPH
jgi:uncharacterized DUF497 family protein